MTEISVILIIIYNFIHRQPEVVKPIIRLFQVVLIHYFYVSVNISLFKILFLVECLICKIIGQR